MDTTAPSVRAEYASENALDDLPAIKHALYLFMNSYMVDSEEYCDRVDPKKERLYISSGYSLIQAVKALMSFEPEDLQLASKQVKHGNDLAYQHRAPPPALASRLAGLVWENSSTGAGAFKSMTMVQRHAELLYAETLFAKALLGVVCSRNWLSFLTEALNFRSMINTYLALGKYLDIVDAEARARGEPEDSSIDKDFRSGVELGVGASNLILSFMPGKLLSVATIFGYTGDREAGLKLLMRCGGWEKGVNEPRVGGEEEGLRRVLADVCLLCFHLVISAVTTRGIDLDTAAIILAWNLKRYPNSVFFLFGEGRLALLRSNPSATIIAHERAVSIQKDYRTLHFISFWESAIARLALWDVDGSLKEWRPLAKEATWSKATYYYGVAVCLLQRNNNAPSRDETKEAAQLLGEIQAVVHKIAGKSIPIEKFVARKARKFASQGNRLFLPALELAYIFEALNHAPRHVLLECMIPDANAEMRTIDACDGDESRYLDGTGSNSMWDDYCLGNLLLGACWKNVAYPDKDAKPSEAIKIEMLQGRKMAEDKALEHLHNVLKNGHKIQLDHYVRYFAHFELGKLYADMGMIAKAQENLDIVISGKPLELNARKVYRYTRSRRYSADSSRSLRTKKGKYSMQSQLQMRAIAISEMLGTNKVPPA